MKIGVCPHCKQEARLTKDHIIPKWLYGKIHIFGVKKNWGNKNIQWICSPCNSLKGGMPDFAHPISRQLADNIMKIIKDQRSNYE